MLVSKQRFTIKYRLLYLGIGVALFATAYSVGAAVALAEKDAEEIRSSFLADTQNIDGVGIFLNNIRVALTMFVPGVGVAIGVYSGVSTGMVYHAFASLSPDLAAANPLSVLATPFGVLELLAYGLAISRSGMLVVQLVKKEERKFWKKYSIATGIEIALVMAALVGGSLIESQMLATAGTS